LKCERQQKVVRDAWELRVARLHGLSSVKKTHQSVLECDLDDNEELRVENCQVPMVSAQVCKNLVNCSWDLMDGLEELRVAGLCGVTNCLKLSIWSSNVMDGNE
jgi:hypothetical protein